MSKTSTFQSPLVFTPLVLCRGHVRGRTTCIASQISPGENGRELALPLEKALKYTYGPSRSNTCIVIEIFNSTSLHTLYQYSQ